MKLNKAWLIFWGFNGSDEDNRLEEYGIRNKIVEILGPRYNFNDCVEYVEILYRYKMLSFSEKSHLEHYIDGRRNRKEMFGVTIPVYTHYQSDIYRKLIKCLKDKGVKSRQYKKLHEQWNNYPRYVVVGHNPYIEGREVFNINIDRNDEGLEILEWEELLIDGKKEKKSYEIKPSFNID